MRNSCSLSNLRIGKQSKMIQATNGNGNPRKNQNQNFRPRLLAIKPVTTGKKSGIAANAKPIITSMI